MEIEKMLAELRAERANLEHATATLERLAAGRGKRRGPSAGLDDSRKTARQAAGEQE